MEKLDMVDRPNIIMGLLAFVLGRRAQAEINGRFLTRGYIWRGTLYAYRVDYGYLDELLAQARGADVQEAQGRSA
jgi:hypothetical protein